MIMISHIQVASNFQGFKTFLGQRNLHVDRCRRITSRIEQHGKLNVLAVYFDYGLQSQAIGDVRFIMTTKAGIPVIRRFDIANGLLNKNDSREFDDLDNDLEPDDSF